MKKYIVAGIGQAAKDTIIVVDNYPKYGLKKKVEKIIFDGGGPVANALYTLSKYKIDTRIATIIGFDQDGDFILSKLIQGRINTNYVIRRENATSHLAFIIVEKSTGERTIFYKPCSGDDIKIQELKKDFFENISFLHLDGFQEEISIFAAKYANKNRIPVMLDAGSYKPYIEKIIQYTDFLVTSYAFAEKYGFDMTIKSFIKIVNYFKRPHITVTMGDKGSFSYHKGEYFYTPAYKIKACDTTGAGDVFHGAMIYGIINKFDIIKCIRLATVISALKCKGFGGRSIPSMKEALFHLKRFKEPTTYY